jgi:hypothetical protein
MGAGLDALVRDLVMVQTTGCRRVGLIPAVHREFCELERKFKSRLERHFKNYGVPRTTLPPEHFKSQGRFSTGGLAPKNVQIFVFKAFQIRIYGVTVPVCGVETFIGLEIISDKKRDRVEAEFLQRVAKKARPYLD